MKIRFAVATSVMGLALSIPAQKEIHVVHAKGSFDIKMTPTEPTDFEKANDITRFTSDKTWHGDFEGVSHGEMITGSTASTGSMAYVAIERMTGKLHGRQGSFTFSHLKPSKYAVTACAASCGVVTNANAAADRTEGRNVSLNFIPGLLIYSPDSVDIFAPHMAPRQLRSADGQLRLTGQCTH